jgi:hypothetical protein
MIKLQPNEIELTGSWVFQNGQIVRDIVCERIEWLINNHLIKLTDSLLWGAWETLFRDPDDNRLWERNFPQSEMQGGGPPRLKCLAPDVAKQKYGSMGGPESRQVV